jgi:hypothetical protein
VANYCGGNVWPKRSNPRFLTPFGVAETGQRDGLDTQEALARLHSGGSLNRSHACAAEGGGSFAAPTGHALSIEKADKQIRRARYWAYDATKGELKLMSASKSDIYTITADAHTCPAIENGHKACYHRAAHRLMQRYTQALGVATAEGTRTVPPAPSSWSAAGEQTANGWKVRDDERANAPMVSPSLYLRGDKYAGVDI